MLGIVARRLLTLLLDSFEELSEKMGRGDGGGEMGWGWGLDGMGRGGVLL